jgi:hypothetical protein
MRQLEAGLRKYNANNQQDVLVEGGKTALTGNAVNIVIGLDDTLFEKEVQDKIERFERVIDEHTARIEYIRYHAGDPHDVLQEHYK